MNATEELRAMYHATIESNNADMYAGYIIRALRVEDIARAIRDAYTYGGEEGYIAGYLQGQRDYDSGKCNQFDAAVKPTRK